MSADRRVDVLLRSFRAATESRFGKVEWRYGRSVPDAVRARFVEAAAELEAARIPPAGWAAWSCDVWREYGTAERVAASRGRRPKVPPIGWVFDPKRIREKADWYARRSGSYAGRRVVMGDLHRDLVRRWEQMAQRLRVAGGQQLGEEAIRAIVRESFPGGFERLRRAAVEEARKTQRALDNLARNGEWLW
jgi:hypothetical protein